MDCIERVDALHFFAGSQRPKTTAFDQGITPWIIIIIIIIVDERVPRGADIEINANSNVIVNHERQPRSRSPNIRRAIS